MRLASLLVAPMLVAPPSTRWCASRRGTSAPAVRLQLFPSDELPEAPPRQAQGQSRGERMATLLGELVAHPEDAPTALREATPMLLEPFRQDLQEDGSIFQAGMSVAEKIEVYEQVLESRIGSAKQPQTRVALLAPGCTKVRHSFGRLDPGLRGCAALGLAACRPCLLRLTSRAALRLIKAPSFVPLRRALRDHVLRAAEDLM